MFGCRGCGVESKGVSLASFGGSSERGRAFGVMLGGSLVRFFFESFWGCVFKGGSRAIFLSIRTRES